MFGFGLKARTAEALRRATIAMMTNHYIDRDSMDGSDISDFAKSALYFDCHAQCLFALHLLFKTSIAGHKPWATMDFFLSSVSGAFADTDKNNGLPDGATAHLIFPRFMSIGQASQATQDADVFAASLVHVVEQDLLAHKEPDGTSCSLADEDLIRAALTNTVESFFAAVSPMFTPDHSI